MLFFPVGETAITTSTLFPQFLQSLAKFLESALAVTSVFDLVFSDTICSSFPLYSNLKAFSHRYTQITIVFSAGAGL